MSTISAVKTTERHVHGSSYYLNNAVIHIENLRLRTFVGFNPEEQLKQQDIVINAHIEFDASKPSRSDNEQDTLDYKVVTKKIISHVEHGRFRLIEKLGADLLDIIMANSAATKATVTVDKPHALRFADSVSVTLSACRLLGEHHE